MRIGCIHTLFDDPRERRAPGKIAEAIAGTGLREVGLDPAGEGVAAEDFDCWLREWLVALRTTDLHVAWIRASRLDESPLWQEIDPTVPVLVPREAGNGHPDELGKDLVVLAQRTGRALLLETGSPLFADARAAAGHLRAIGSPRLALDFDLGAYGWFHPTANVEIALQRVLDRVGSVRLRDVTGNPGERRSPPPGQGAGEFARLAEILQAVAFRGPCVIDCDRPTSGPWPATVSAVVSESLAYLRDCGWCETRKFA